MRLTAGAVLALCAASAAAATAELEPVTVTATRSPSPLVATPGNVGLIGEEAIETVAPMHASELFWRVPGAWVTHNSGQESLVGIRSPVLSGAGACGAFLFLEDGLPSRPAGFCNVNQLFELNVEQARGVEVVRGPGSALYGSNALHGTVNVLMPSAASGRDYVLLDTGPADYLRGRFSAGQWDGRAGFRVTGQAAHDGGWRDDTGYDQAKVNATWLERDGPEEREAMLAATTLSQDTAGYITGFEAYRDARERRSNQNPEAFRDADSFRASLAWRHDNGERRLELRPFLRASRSRKTDRSAPGCKSPSTPVPARARCITASTSKPPKVPWSSSRPARRPACRRRWPRPARRASTTITMSGRSRSRPGRTGSSRSRRTGASVSGCARNA
jgi:outer membrane cobalamin receptor